jgi:hypothetical protein
MGVNKLIKFLHACSDIVRMARPTLMDGTSSVTELLIFPADNAAGEQSALPVGAPAADECGFTEQQCERRPALRLLLHPTSTESIVVRTSEKPEAYLDKCHQNLRAEIWMLYRGKVNPSIPRWREVLLERAFVVTSSRGPRGKVTAAYRDASRSQPWELEELDWNLVVLGDRLCLLQPCKDERGRTICLRILQGAEIHDANARADEILQCQDLEKVLTMLMPANTPAPKEEAAAPAAVKLDDMKGLKLVNKDADDDFFGAVVKKGKGSKKVCVCVWRGCGCGSGCVYTHTQYYTGGRPAQARGAEDAAIDNGHH